MKILFLLHFFPFVSLCLHYNLFRTKILSYLLPPYLSTLKINEWELPSAKTVHTIGRSTLAFSSFLQRTVPKNVLKCFYAFSVFFNFQRSMLKSSSLWAISLKWAFLLKVINVFNVLLCSIGIRLLFISEQSLFHSEICQ